MAGLIITHVPAGDLSKFEVIRQRDGKRAPSVEVVSPYNFPVREHPNDNLMSQLAWYLERFLEYPFPPRTEQAADAEDALESWGRKAFSTLFDPRIWEVEDGAKIWIQIPPGATSVRVFPAATHSTRAA